MLRILSGDFGDPVSDCHSTVLNYTTI